MGIQEIIVECTHRLTEGVLAELFDQGIRQDDIVSQTDDELLLRSKNPYSLQQSLQCPNALYQYLYFPIPRPKALLGHQHFGRLCSQINQLKETLPEADAIRLEAAGKSSSVMTRVHDELQKACFPNTTTENHPLLMRLRPARYRRDGWEVLIRCSLLPLSVRPWRQHDIKGALNGSLAASIIRLLPSADQGLFLDPMCGSGTFLIEYKKRFPHASCIGSDRSPAMLAACRDHLIAARCTPTGLLQADARSLPFPDASVQTIVCNPPWGERIALADDAAFHEAVLKEIVRLLKKGAQCFCLSQRQEALQKQLEQSDLRILKRYQLTQRGFTPTLFQVQRT